MKEAAAAEARVPETQHLPPFLRCHYLSSVGKGCFIDARGPARARCLYTLARRSSNFNRLVFRLRAVNFASRTAAAVRFNSGESAALRGRKKEVVGALRRILYDGRQSLCSLSCVWFALCSEFEWRSLEGFLDDFFAQFMPKQGHEVRTYGFVREA